MRFFQILFILLITLVAAGASAQEGGAKSGVPSLDEYNNIPPGILMTADKPATAENTESVQASDEIMTMDDLVSAYNKGQYDIVAKHIIPIANSNYPQAQEMLGVMYHNGQGVVKDQDQAMDWLTKAAEAGRPLAQHHLAIMSFTGNGAPQDTVKALMWLYITIVHYPDGPEKTRAIQDRDSVASQLSRRDRERAYSLAHDWLEKRNEAALLELQTKD